ncbi:MAG: pilus assembly protein [Bdellovibrionota bacterium]
MREVDMKTKAILIASLLVATSLAFAQGEAPVDPAEKAASSVQSTSNESSITVGATPPPLDSVRPADAPEKQEYELEKAENGRERKIPLFVGIEQIEQLPYIPNDAQFKGTFKKVTKVGVDRATNTLRFEPTKAGFGTLTIHDAQGKKVYEFNIVVEKSDHAKIAQEIRSLLSDIEGITIKIINNRVVIDGQVLLPRQINRIIGVINQYGPTRAASLVTLSPIAQRKIAQAIANDINLPEITVRAVNDKFILEGTANDEGEKSRADAIAQMYVPDLIKEDCEKSSDCVKLRKVFVLNLIQVKPAAPRDPGKIIQLVVHFVQLNKNFQKSFKFQFTPTIEDKSAVSFTNDSRQPSGVISSITGIVSNLLPKLNWAKQYGHARVLQSSSLIVLNGQKGDLRNTTKIPYQTVGAEGQMQTNFEEAGLITTITPTILNPRSDSIQLQLDFSMKSLLGITDKGPMVSNSSMQTVIIVRSSQSAAVGGLITNTTGTDYNKLPKGSAVDPLISLYASKSFQRNQDQFVVFVTPIIKASASQGSEKIKEKFRLRD